MEKEKMSLNSVLMFDEFYNGTSTPVGQYFTSSGFKKEPNYEFRKRQPYYRIGIVDVCTIKIFNIIEMLIFYNFLGSLKHEFCFILVQTMDIL